MIAKAAALVVATALGLAACGGGNEDEEYKDDFPRVSDRLVSLGQDVGRAIESAGQSTDDALAADFQGFAGQLGEVRDELEGLEPPGDLVDEQDALVAAIGDVRDSLEGIADAAEASDPDAAREATEALVQGSQELRDARRALARAVRDL